MATAQSPSDIQSKVLRSLEGTPFAAKSLVPLEHGEGFLASNTAFEIPTSRCHIEDACLRALSSSSADTSTAPGSDNHDNGGYRYVVRTPKYYPFPQDPTTQIQEYLPNGANLKVYALKHWSAAGSSSLDEPGSTGLQPPPTQARQLGRALGRWLRAFHGSSELLRRGELRKAVAANTAMQGLKHTINFQWLLDRVAQFPDILSEAAPVFEEVKEMAAAEVRDESQLQVIHGDFWTAYSSPTPPLSPNAEPVPVFVVDWEMAQLGLPNLDLGQMLAEMYELWLYRRIRGGLWMMEGFVEGYGAVTEAFALRTAIQLGAHLVCFGTSVPGWGTPEQVQEVARTGRDIICHAWRKNRDWFEEEGELSGLFSTVKP
ncbi:hypothetical protein PG989_002893 [Apiospora arundinis]